MTVVQPNENKPLPPPHSNGRGRAMALAIGLILLGGLIWFAAWFFYFQYIESTDDAYVNGNLVNVKSVIPGTPIAFFADDTDVVKEGQVLVQLDPTEYEVNYQQQLTLLAEETLKTRQLYDALPVAKAQLESRRVSLEKARYDHENRMQLKGTGAISGQEYTHSQDDLNLAESAFQEATYQLKAARDKVGDIPIEKHPAIEAQKDRVRDAYYKLHHTTIYAPSSGYIAKRAVQVGQTITANTALMAIIPSDGMWVDANFKETELTKMRVGQPAEVWFDIFGSVKFKGTVIGIGSGTGSVFSLIPPQNATGNWIKIVQRLPVRIGLDPEQFKDYPLRLGLSSYVRVSIVDDQLPWMQQKPPQKAVAKTNVFEINFEPLEKKMDAIVKEYSKR